MLVVIFFWINFLDVIIGIVVFVDMKSESIFDDKSRLILDMLEILCEYNMYFFLLNVFFEFSMEIDCFIY